MINQVQPVSFRLTFDTAANHEFGFVLKLENHRAGKVNLIGCYDGSRRTVVRFGGGCFCKVGTIQTGMYRKLEPKLLTVLREGYTRKLFVGDLLGGLTVGVVALPLAIALAIASGAKPEQGLYTAIFAGFVIAVLGGSRAQISGPTGAFIVIVYGVIQKYGYDGLVVATLIAASC